MCHLLHSFTSSTHFQPFRKCFPTEYSFEAEHVKLPVTEGSELAFTKGINIDSGSLNSNDSTDHITRFLVIPVGLFLRGGGVPTVQLKLSITELNKIT